MGKGKCEKFSTQMMHVALLLNVSCFSCSCSYLLLLLDHAFSSASASYMHRGHKQSPPSAPRAHSRRSFTGKSISQ